VRLADGVEASIELVEEFALKSQMSVFTVDPGRRASSTGQRADIALPRLEQCDARAAAGFKHAYDILSE
jgi:hypothetical protein